jgi:hypothetical protein
MQKAILKKHYQKILYTFTLSLLLLGTACRVSLVPQYDAVIAAEIDNTAKEVDHFYLSMLETTQNKDGQRSYNKFVSDYVNIETDINALLNKNRIRPLNTNSVKICEITLAKFIKYKEEHKRDTTLSDGLIKLNRKYMDDLFFAMRVAESAKKIIAENSTDN